MRKGFGGSCAGGGHYTIRDHLYTNTWNIAAPGNGREMSWGFIISLNEDTLIQRGREKVEKTGTDRINIEKFFRLDK
ncbi:MAG: hypothetical protein ACXVMS_15940 [Flavisolibacter sp.]